MDFFQSFMGLRATKNDLFPQVTDISTYSIINW